MDTAVKQRLLGGIVLVAGAAVLLPLMLDGSGAKLLSRLEPIPAKPVTATVEQARPQLNQQQQEAEDAVDAAHSDDAQFYAVGKPATDTAVAPAPTVPDAAKTPEQLAAEQAARQRAKELLASPDEISVEEAQAQKLAADKAEREFAKQPVQTVAPVTSPADSQQSVVDVQQAKAEKDKAAKLAAEKAAAKKLEAEKALAMLEAPDSQAQKQAEKQLSEKLAKQKADEQAKAEKIAVEKAKAEAKKKEDKADELAKAEKLSADKDKAKAAAEKLAKQKADEQAKTDKLAADKAKAESKKKEEEKAKLALEGKQKEQQAKDQAKDSKSEAWVVQVASLSDHGKADALSAKLGAKGYRARVVKNGETWKVVVGPELQREAANTLKGRLSKESALGVSGAWVAPWKP